MRSADRDHTIDAIRAIAVAGVVCGHWLVTGLVIGDNGAWRQSSPLTHVPALAPASWFLQTLGLLFFAGGFGAASGTGRTRAGRRPLKRLLVPVGVLVGAWAAALIAATLLGVPWGTRRTIAVLVVFPLWFLLPYLALRLVTRPLIKAVDRAGPYLLAVPMIGVVALSDADLLPGWTAILAAWSVPWILGIAAARLGRERLPAGALLIAGVAGLAALITVAGYPMSAVGVPGDGRSNLNPPSLFAVALALAQIGLCLTVARLRPPGPSRVVTSLNRAALPIYLGHQSVLVGVVALASLSPGEPVPGLLTKPDGPLWIFQRMLWLPFLALVLAAVIRLAWPATRPARQH